MAIIAPTAAGADIVPVAANGGGDKYANSGTERLQVTNGGGSPITVTFDSQQACNQGFDHDQAVTVGAGKTRLFAAVSSLRFNDGSGYVNITYSAVTSVTVAVLSQ